MANVTVTSDDDYIIHLAEAESTNTGWHLQVLNNTATPAVLMKIDTHGVMRVAGRFVGSDTLRFTNSSGSGDVVQFMRNGTTYVAVKADGATDASYGGVRIHHSSTNPSPSTFTFADGDCFWKVDSGGSHTFRVYYAGGWMDIATSLC